MRPPRGLPASSWGGGATRRRQILMAVAAAFLVWVLVMFSGLGRGGGGGEAGAADFAGAAGAGKASEEPVRGPQDHSDKYFATVQMTVGFGEHGGAGGGGKLVLGLFADTPKTSENFRALCTGEKGKSLDLRGAKFHRIIPNFVAQGGLNSGKSIYGGAFPDENFLHKHTGAGILSMANAGPNTQASQFFITYGPQPHLDGKHVVFGRVLSGWNTMKQMEALGSGSGKPSSPVTIAECFELGSQGALRAEKL